MLEMMLIIQKETHNSIQESCYDSYDQRCGSHHTFSSSEEKCVVKEPEEIRDDGLQIHGHIYEGKYEIV